MATLHQITASNIAEISGQKQVENLLQEYRFDCDYKLEDGAIRFIGYAGFRVRKEVEADSETPEYQEVTEEFLDRLRQYLEEGLVIHGIGNAKLRFPLLAYKFRVTPEAVHYNDLNQSEDILTVEE